MVKKIEQPITGVEVVADAPPVEEPTAEIIHMHEKVERPEMLLGSTYKIKTPLSAHALYVTINDIVLNAGTQHELRRPFEVFINSKNMDHFQWIVALTRIISAVFRKGGDVTFLVDEMRSVFDPRGGYFKKGGRYTPSLVAEIGDVIETHLRSIGLLGPARPRTEINVAHEPKAKLKEVQVDEDDSGIPGDALHCSKCFAKAVVALDNCLTCLNCGESKCG
ncbi:MAG: NrdJb [Gammaproteobacteria bacterium]|nr:NrdJb [Gammaproteobacteria bacterium]